MGRSAMILSLILAVAFTAGANPVIAKTFSIGISGDDGASVIGSCLVRRGEDHEVLALAGKVPLEQVIDADFVPCRFDAAGRVVIDAASDAGQR